MKMKSFQKIEFFGSSRNQLAAEKEIFRRHLTHENVSQNEIISFFSEFVLFCQWVNCGFTVLYVQNKMPKQLKSRLTGVFSRPIHFVQFLFLIFSRKYHLNWLSSHYNSNYSMTNRCRIFCLPHSLVRFIQCSYHCRSNEFAYSISIGRKRERNKSD